MTRILAMVAAIAVTFPVSAINLSAFKDAPITRLNAEEAKAYIAFVTKTLNDEPDGATAEWKAPKTTFTGKVTPPKSFASGKLKCRTAVIDNESRDRQMRGTYTFCKDDTGDWHYKAPEGKKK